MPARRVCKGPKVQLTTKQKRDRRWKAKRKRIRKAKYGL